MNQLQSLGTHNSYHVQIEGTNIEEWQYSHEPLDVQAGALGVRQYELDVNWDPETGAFTVYHVPVLDLDALATPDAAALTAQALDWVAGKLAADRPVVIAASAPPEKVAALQAKLGRDAAGALIETAMAAIAEGLVARGVGRLVVAGGETSGAVVQRLGVTALRIGPEIDPGVPWTFAEPRGLHLALKSGNFGARDFFLKAFDHG
jgi:uncharacterized protein YgbK (DUF1537 family)